MKRNNKGFTMAELLIVVAIIAVLVAIAIPIFTKRLEASRETTDLANLRSAYAAAYVSILQDFIETGTAPDGWDTEKVNGNDVYYTFYSSTTSVDTGLSSTTGDRIGRGTALDGGADLTGLPGGIYYSRTSNTEIGTAVAAANNIKASITDGVMTGAMIQIVYNPSEDTTPVNVSFVSSAS